MTDDRRPPARAEQLAAMHCVACEGIGRPFDAPTAAAHVDRLAA